MWFTEVIFMINTHCPWPGPGCSSALWSCFFCKVPVQTWPSFLSGHWPTCQERSWGKPCQELWLEHKKCDQSSYLRDFFKSTRNTFDTLSLQLSLSASAIFLGSRISPMTEGFLKEKENVEVFATWIQSFPSLHSLIPSWGTKHPEGCCAKVCLKHRSDGWGAWRARVKAMMLCCCECSVPSWDLHTWGRFFQSETSQLLGSFFPCSGTHTALLQGLAPGF